MLTTQRERFAPLAGAMLIWLVACPAPATSVALASMVRFFILGWTGPQSDLPAWATTLTLCA